MYKITTTFKSSLGHKFEHNAHIDHKPDEKELESIHEIAVNAFLDLFPFDMFAKSKVTVKKES